MFDPTSRHYRIADATYVDPEGKRIAYKRRRLPPLGNTFHVQAVVAVQPADRLDLIAARTLGDPQQFWRIADANDALNPFDLLQRRTLNIPALKL
ncbi:MAG TPA: hypothetical protein VN924_31455 [Bryobacteraceae bacterium]|nr:hypothetical protein [Bryobacteraceae bacterium]